MRMTRPSRIGGVSSGLDAAGRCQSSWGVRTSLRCYRAEDFWLNLRWHQYLRIRPAKCSAGIREHCSVHNGFRRMCWTSGVNGSLKWDHFQLVKKTWTLKASEEDPEKWIAAIHRNNWIPGTEKWICGSHFVSASTAASHRPPGFQDAAEETAVHVTCHTPPASGRRLGLNLSLLLEATLCCHGNTGFLFKAGFL
ncbi:uncharacterized protein LOC133423935 isoform X2 [Cololabis saira]|uniref:uncharacterized protein LOC133423935 isoform X2 n=1 Tax=Cololabis saira TaxID=129043 RepID=UPI002AD23634|nr:uncharacterized protein LOC133423935 isoform X2 [Cololabis saira]